MLLESQHNVQNEIPILEDFNNEIQTQPDASPEHQDTGSVILRNQSEYTNPLNICTMNISRQPPKNLYEEWNYVRNETSAQTSEAVGKNGDTLS